MVADNENGRGGVSTYVSGAQRFFARALHIFFGKPLLFLLPGLLISGYGVYYATSQPDEYQSVGVLSVSSETFLAELSPVRTSQQTFETISTRIAREFNELMQTDGFARSVAEGAGFTTTGPGAVSLTTIRNHVYAAPLGDSLLRMIASADNADRARVLANSAIGSFKNFVISSEVLGFDAAEAFYNDQLDDYKAEVDAASKALEDYLSRHPEPIDARDERDVAEQLEIERLNDELTRSQDRFNAAFDNRDQSRLATVQSSADIDQRFRILDEPQLPPLPTSGLKALATTVILFGVLGLLVSLGALVLACLMDRSIHTASDLERIGATVRAVVPRTKAVRVESPRHLAAVAPARPAPMRSAG